MVKIRNKIIASGLVIVKDGKLLVSNDGKDSFFKIPGGKVKPEESLENCAICELKEETGFGGRVLEKLSTLKLNKNPQTGEEMEIFLYHFQGEIENFKNNFNSFEHSYHKICWVEINKLNKEDVAPNITFLKEKGELK